MFFLIDHVGWITDDISLFEKFWCDLLGYKCVNTSSAAHEMMATLFGAGEATIKRYKHPKNQGPDIEIHYFLNHGETEDLPFYRFGINHICLMVGGTGSRQEVLGRLPDDVEVKLYDNPGGWQNIFIKDYEGNWIELRESM